MDMYKWLDITVKERRQKSLELSDQLTLGEMILKLEPIVKNQWKIKNKYKEEAAVYYDFENLFPTEIDSWRGIYRELALNYCMNPDMPKDLPLKVTKFLTLLKNAVGKSFEGYKGGSFIMNKDTQVWVANYGNAGSTAVIDIIDNDYNVIIITGYRES